MFDREFEWSALAAFAGDERGGAHTRGDLRRQSASKTFLLRALCEATGGFYFAADEAADGESLRRIGAALGEPHRRPGAAGVRRIGTTWSTLCWRSAGSGRFRS